MREEADGDGEEVSKAGGKRRVSRARGQRAKQCRQQTAITEGGARDITAERRAALKVGWECWS
jgi:hypothetical protein